MRQSELLVLALARYLAHASKIKETTNGSRRSVGCEAWKEIKSFAARRLKTDGEDEHETAPRHRNDKAQKIANAKRESKNLCAIQDDRKIKSHPVAIQQQSFTVE